VTAPKSWPNSGPQTRAKVDYQVAAPTVSRTPTWQRATNAQQRLRMEGWRLRRLEIRLGSTERKHKAVLTQTGLLMEGVGPWLTREGVNSWKDPEDCRWARSASPWRAAGVVEKYDVGFQVGAQDAEGPAVGREAVILDFVRRKVREQVARSAI
jgi:hypothetical protein